MIPDEIISEIRSKADIVEVIGQHVQLKKAGRNYKGLCPFHGEKTPSFNVQREKGFFHCFGCQKHGDVFSFVMELEGKSFVEVAEQLGARFGIEVPQLAESPELRKARGERAGMLDLNRVAATFFRELLGDERRGAPGRAYLDQRGVRAEVTDKFQLGYAASDWHLLADRLKESRGDLELATKLGLVARQPRAGGYYDRFRDRLVCPVVVPGGEIAGFSARVVGTPAPAPDGSAPPKYINSPESPVYKKSKLLFGLAQAREGMQQTGRAVLVEGNFDVITLHQAGFTEVVAPLGTALTLEQLQLLKRLVDRVVLVYDGDRAGYKATLAALELAFEADVEVRIAKVKGAQYGLSGGVDPDALVAGGGGKVLRDAIDEAISGFEYFCFEVWGRAKSSADARARALNDAARVVAKVTEPTKRNLIVGTLASALGVSVDLAWNAMKHGQYAAGPRPQAPAPDARRPTPDAPVALHELEVVSLLCDHPALIATPEADKVSWLLTDARLRDMYSAARVGRSLSDLAPELLPTQAAQHVLSGKYADAKDPRGQLLAMEAQLERRRELVATNEQKQRLVDAQQRGGGDRELVRLEAQLAQARRKGDRELVEQLGQQISSRQLSSNRNQAD